MRYLLIGFFVVMTAVQSAFACSCVGFNTIDEHIDAVDVIFVGVASGTNAHEGEMLNTYLSSSTMFRVAEILKGGLAEETSISHAPANGANCGLLFKDGQSYLVFAHKTQDGRLSTSTCSRTRPTSREGRWSLDAYAEALSE